MSDLSEALRRYGNLVAGARGGVYANVFFYPGPSPYEIVQEGKAFPVIGWDYSPAVGVWFPIVAAGCGASRVECTDAEVRLVRRPEGES